MIRSLLALLLLTLAAPLLAIDPLPFHDEAERVRYQNLMRELRCLQCQNESLAESNAEVAKDMRRVAFELMRQGKSDAEIVDFFVARYGDFVRFRPAWQRNTVLLWLGPLAVALLAVAWAAAALRARARSLEREATPSAEDWD